MTKDILAQFMEKANPVTSKAGLVGEEAETLYIQPQEMETRNELVAPGPERLLTREEEEQIQQAFQPRVEENEETPEQRKARLDREDAETRASIPMFNGMPIPDPALMPKPQTIEEMKANPSNFLPALEEVQMEAPASSGEKPAEITVSREIQPAEITVTHNHSVVVPEPAPAPVVADTRQMWLCLQQDGLRNPRCEPFRSNAHLIDQRVECPNCGGWHVRRVEPGEPIS
jgi:hypothetical protein